MPNVVKKLSISLDLAQNMVNAAVVKARELGVAENVAILDEGGNLKGSTRLGPIERQRSQEALRNLKLLK
jgi:uncharacterized protein GlcG (DUF336 family)